MDNLNGKIAVVTGAANGIGKALATQCLEKGMCTVLADNNQDALQLTTITTDVADYASMQSLANKTIEQYKHKAHKGHKPKKQTYHCCVIEKPNILDIQFYLFVNIFLPILHQHCINYLRSKMVTCFSGCFF